MAVSETPAPRRALPAAHQRTALILVGVFVLMVGAAFAAVPFYRAFCQATGWAGTVRRTAAGPEGVASGRPLTVHFDTNVRGVPVTLTSETATQQIKVGKTALAYFTMHNTSDRDVTVRATYNVVPLTVAPYFLKLKCFCFDAQTIKAHETRTFPVVYYVDGKVDRDEDAKVFSDVTLSYTLYEVPAPATSPAS